MGTMFFDGRVACFSVYVVVNVSLSVSVQQNTTMMDFNVKDLLGTFCTKQYR